MEKSEKRFDKSVIGEENKKKISVTRNKDGSPNAKHLLHPKYNVNASSSNTKANTIGADQGSEAFENRSINSWRRRKRHITLFNCVTCGRKKKVKRSKSTKQKVVKVRDEDRSMRTERVADPLIGLKKKVVSKVNLVGDTNLLKTRKKEKEIVDARSPHSETNETKAKQILSGEKQNKFEEQYPVTTVIKKKSFASNDAQKLQEFKVVEPSTSKINYGELPKGTCPFCLSNARTIESIYLSKLEKDLGRGLHISINNYYGGLGKYNRNLNAARVRTVKTFVKPRTKEAVTSTDPDLSENIINRYVTCVRERESYKSVCRSAEQSD